MASSEIWRLVRCGLIGCCCLLASLGEWQGEGMGGQCLFLLGIKNRCSYGLEVLLNSYFRGSIPNSAIVCSLRLYF